MGALLVTKAKKWSIGALSPQQGERGVFACKDFLSNTQILVLECLKIKMLYV